MRQKVEIINDKNMIITYIEIMRYKVLIMLKKQWDKNEKLSDKKSK